jgi:Type IX secretion system protein PorV
MLNRILYTGAVLCVSAFYATSQAQTITGRDTSFRVVTSGVPFMAFTPDARSAAMGDAGAALSPDANSTYWGAAKLAASNKDYGVAVSYTPWLRNITEDMYFAYLSGFKKIGKNQAFGASLMYFDHGLFQSRNNVGANTGDFYANEFYGSIAYSRKLSDNFSMGLNVKYMNSNLTGNYAASGQNIKAASTAAGDISAFYSKNNIDDASGKGWNYAAALMIQNIGGKISYGGTTTSFIPTTFKIGGAATRHIDAHNKFTVALDLNKLLIPTPPIRDASQKIIRGKDDNISPITAMFTSWNDAPDGFNEELKEFTVSVGAEYWYNDLFAARLGYFGEAREKGDRKYFTIGFGARVQQRYGIDFAYLMPQRQGSPLANTFRVSLLIDIFKKSVDEIPEEDSKTEE